MYAGYHVATGGHWKFGCGEYDRRVSWGCAGSCSRAWRGVPGPRAEGSQPTPYQYRHRSRATGTLRRNGGVSDSFFGADPQPANPARINGNRGTFFLYISLLDTDRQDATIVPP
jgi:hypothetical protein